MEEYINDNKTSKNEIDEKCEIRENSSQKKGTLKVIVEKGINGFKSIKDGASAFIKDYQNQKDENNAINKAFEIESKKFVIHYSNGKTKNVFCIINEEEKTLKLREKIDIEKVSFFKDEIKQNYYIEHISLNPYTFEINFMDKVLKLELQVVYYKNEKDVPKEVHIDKSININKSNISGAVGNGAQNKKETKLGIDFNLFKKG